MAFAGSIRTETGVLKSGGANDGVTPYTIKLTSNANPVWYSSPLETDEFYVWNSTVGTPVTISFDILSDGALLTNADAWLEVQHIGATDKPLGSFASGRAGLMDTAVSHPLSNATWTGAETMGAPKKQRLSVTFTPQEVGPVLCRVMLGKPNTVLYVDQKLVE